MTTIAGLSLNALEELCSEETKLCVANHLGASLFVVSGPLEACQVDHKPPKSRVME